MSSPGIAEFTPEFFDDASRAWRANKTRLSSGAFSYKCSRDKCKNKVVDDIGGVLYCRWHKPIVFRSFTYIEQLD